MAALTRTVYPEHSHVEEGRLIIGGCDAVDLAREFGTPAYVVAEDDLRARAREFRDALGQTHEGPGAVVYASKAFPVTAAMRVFEDEGLYVDVASGGELHLALNAGFRADRIVVHGNAKSARELEHALALRETTLVVDNFDEIERLLDLMPDDGHQRVLVRVIPGVAVDSHHAIVTGQEDSKFGFGLDDASRAIGLLRRDARIHVAGLHMHIGSQIFDVEPYREAMAALASLGEFDTYDIGGGYGATYTATDRHVDVPSLVAEVVAAAHEMLGARGKEVLIEPGRSLVATAGVTLYSVESVKENVRTWVAVDGGMSDNLRPMLYDAIYDADIAARMRTSPQDGDLCTVAGKHCESGDVLVRDVRLRAPRAGDVLVTPTTGAYGHALANNYNGVPRPPVIFVSNGDARVVVRRETYDDLILRDV